MNIETIPARVLTLAAAFIGGFMIAAWCLPSLNHKPRTTTQDAGVFLVIPSKFLHSPTNLADLKGKQVRLVRRKGDSSPCVISHKPARLQTSDQNVFLEVGLDGLESLVVSIHSTDLIEPDLVDVNSAHRIASCSQHPRVTYGS